jgi:hypothetical protein
LPAPSFLVVAWGFAGPDFSLDKDLTPSGHDSSVKESFMSENLSNLPTGAVPPKPAEPAKVQPKKETVRINLPPKPTATPAIKLPTQPAAGAPAPAPAVAPAMSAAAPASAPVAVTRPMATAAPRAVAPAPMLPQSAGGASIGMVDKILAILAAVVGVGVLVSVLLMSN